MGSRYIRHPFTAHCISEQKISKFKREEKKRKKSFKKPSQDLTAARRILRTHIPQFCLREKTSNQFEKFFFPLPLFFVITFLFHYFFSFFNLHIKLEKKRNILKEKKKSITNQEDGTSFPPHKILKHLKDLKILSDPKI